MRFRKALAFAGATLIVAGLVATETTPAFALPTTPADISIECRNNNATGAADQTFAGAAGDTFTVTNTSLNGTCWIASVSGTYAGHGFTGYSGVVTVTGTTPDGTYSGVEDINHGDTATFTIVASGAFTIRYGYAHNAFSTLTVASTDVPSDDPEATPIPDWVQAIGRHSKDATCPTGWSTSWQTWAESVTGGWVCTRTIPSLG